MPINVNDLTLDYKTKKKQERNDLLKSSDVYMIVDYPINDYQRNLIKNYRQSLRDYFQKPEVINWIFTLENQELPPLPSFPDLSLKFIDAEASASTIPMEIDINSSNIYN